MKGDVAVGWEMVIWGRCQGEETVMRTVTGMGDRHRGGSRDRKWARDWGGVPDRRDRDRRW